MQVINLDYTHNLYQKNETFNKVGAKYSSSLTSVEPDTELGTSEQIFPWLSPGWLPPSPLTSSLEAWK